MQTITGILIQRLNDYISQIVHSPATNTTQLLMLPLVTIRSNVGQVEKQPSGGGKHLTISLQKLQSQQIVLDTKNKSLASDIAQVVVIQQSIYRLARQRSITRIAVN
jgi:hypothetical protein